MPGSVAVFYLARGSDEDALKKFAAFRDSYRHFPAGQEHQLFIIFKGFQNAAALSEGRAVFQGLDHQPIYVEDVGYDLGAYFAAVARVDHENLCFFNTASRILGTDWLAKLARNLWQPDVGIVSCTSSYEAPRHPGHPFIAFPNPHLRSNAFMIRRRDFWAMRPRVPLIDKVDVYMLEHGPQSMTRQLAAAGLKPLLVGKNGRGYGASFWPESRTFRQADQGNLLVGDNQSDYFATAPLPEKRRLHQLCWGDAATRLLHGLFAVPSEHRSASGATLPAPGEKTPSRPAAGGSRL